MLNDSVLGLISQGQIPLRERCILKHRHQLSHDPFTRRIRRVAATRVWRWRRSDAETRLGE